MTTPAALPDPTDPRAVEAEIARLRVLLAQLTAALVGVAALALVFTAVNVTAFARDHGVSGSIAWLLDPMLALALATGLLTDSRLAEHHVRPPAWGSALRWFTGIATLTVNTWTAWWPTGGVGVPRDADAAAVVLHSIPPVLLMLLAEAVAAYRRRITDLITRLRTPPPPPHPQPRPSGTPPQPAGTPPRPQPPQSVANEPTPTPIVASAPPTPTPPQDGRDGSDDLYLAAWRLDQRTRTETGRPASIRLIRRTLRLKQDRAVHLRAWLNDHPPTSS
ncbi:hypothetical protein [Embleya sp. NPDC020630]|uniref:hypothetical protein n=1 Tax=Embleya sp. NPDC020630 TaxID=3363979 RepID=UPI0037B58D33